MHFAWGEDWATYFERLAYRGFIGFLYETTLEGVITWIICGVILIFAIIGIVSVFKRLFTGGRKPTSYERWERERKRAEKRTGSKL